MRNLLDKLETGRKFFNYNYERFISKTLGKILLGHEVAGYEYNTPTSEEIESQEAYKIKETKSNGIETSLTLDYRKNAWGIERIVLDTISNHLPADSRGDSIAVEYLQDGNWIDFRDYDKKKSVEAIRIKDDGKGFDYKLLDVLYSTKTKNTKSVGQFGEGMKLVAAASLRENVDLEYRSRDWSAKPYAKEESIDEESFQRLCFNVEKSQPIMQGSETVFHNPNDLLIEQVNQLSDTVLQFNREYEILSTGRPRGYEPKILDLKNGKTALFVKGIRIKNGLGRFMAEFGELFGGFGNSGFDSIFSYDLGIDDISPDRQLADESKVRSSIRALLQTCKNTNVHRAVLETAYRTPNKDFEEYHALKQSNKQKKMDYMEEMLFMHERKQRKNFSDDNTLKKIFYKEFIEGEDSSGDNTLKKIFNKGFIEGEESSGDNTWRKMFYEVFGKKAVLESGSIDFDKDAHALGYNVIKLNPHMKNYLKDIGIKSASDLLQTEREYKWIAKRDLTVDEARMLDLIPEIHRVVLGFDLETSVKVYEGQYLLTKSAEGHNLRVGEELKTDCGFYTQEDPENSEQDLIGIKRTQLGTRHDFMKTYIHELGHKVTGKRDYDREFTDFFVDALARLSAYYMDKTPANQ